MSKGSQPGWGDCKDQARACYFIVDVNLSPLPSQAMQVLYAEFRLIDSEHLITDTHMYLFHPWVCVHDNWIPLGPEVAKIAYIWSVSVTIVLMSWIKMSSLPRNGTLVLSTLLNTSSATIANLYVSRITVSRDLDILVRLKRMSCRCCPLD